jgi:hypothetical protein
MWWLVLYSTRPSTDFNDSLTLPRTFVFVCDDDDDDADETLSRERRVADGTSRRHKMAMREE